MSVRLLVGIGIVLNIMFIAVNAWAQTAQITQGSGLGSLIPLILIFIIFFFLIIRPQQKKIKAHQAMVQSLKRGDRVVTSGGIIGKITKVNEEQNTVQVEIASNVEVTVLKANIAEAMDRTQPANDASKKEEKSKLSK